MVMSDLKLELEPGVLGVITLDFTRTQGLNDDFHEVSRTAKCHAYEYAVDSDRMLTLYRVEDGRLKIFAVYTQVSSYEEVSE
jgi:hypothetical protein